MRNYYTKAKYIVKKYERYILPLSLAFGFVIDSLTLNKADSLIDNLVILTYLVILGGSIFFLHLPDFKNKITPFLPAIVQFSFGNLFSALVVFYTRSGDFLVSLPFLIILLILFVGRDWFHRKYTKLTFQISIFYIALLSYFTLISPVLFRQINVWVFLLGGVFSLIAIFLYILIIKKGLKKSFYDYESQIKVYIISIFIIFNLFYFTNTIPPIPLALKEGVVAHNLTRLESGDYRLTYEKPEWFRFYKYYAKTIHVGNGDPVYVFGSIYAPTKLKGTIFHQWSYFDEKNSRWKDTDRIPIQISGGRYEGYRGYSFKSSLIEGKWRVDIETESGQVVGRIKFNVNKTEKSNELITNIF